VECLAVALGLLGEPTSGLAQVSVGELLCNSIGKTHGCFLLHRQRVIQNAVLMHHASVAPTT
jgi:hypothetical protein